MKVILLVQPAFILVLIGIYFHNSAIKLACAIIGLAYLEVVRRKGGLKITSPEDRS